MMIDGLSIPVICDRQRSFAMQGPHAFFSLYRHTSRLVDYGRSMMPGCICSLMTGRSASASSLPKNLKIRSASTCLRSWDVPRPLPSSHPIYRHTATPPHHTAQHDTLPSCPALGPGPGGRKLCKLTVPAYPTHTYAALDTQSERSTFNLSGTMYLPPIRSNAAQVNRNPRTVQGLKGRWSLRTAYLTTSGLRCLSCRKCDPHRSACVELTDVLVSATIPALPRARRCICAWV